MVNLQDGCRQHVSNSDVATMLYWFECWEDVERYFEIDLSCGDGLFLPDIQNDAALMEKYDGNVDARLVRYKATGKLRQGDFWFVFTCNDDYMRNGKPRFSRCSISGGVVSGGKSEKKKAVVKDNRDAEIHALRNELAELKAKMPEK